MMRGGAASRGVYPHASAGAVAVRYVLPEVAVVPWV